MTSITTRLQHRLDHRAPAAHPAEQPVVARRILTVATIGSAVVFLIAAIGVVVDPRLIGGELAWIKPAKFGFSITLYLVTLRWMLGLIPGHRRLTAALATVICAAFLYEVAWIVVQVVRGTTSHFNAATAFDAIAFNVAGAVVSFIFMATVVIAVLALRTRGLDAGIAAGLRWGLIVCCVGMAEAVSMLLNGTTTTTIGGHTVGAPDGGPGMPFTDWSSLHGDLRIGHFVGLHGMQLLPILGWLLISFTPFTARLRRDLSSIAGIGYIGLVVLVWWQAERGQALLRPDGLTLAAAAVLVVAVGGATSIAVAVEQRRKRVRIPSTPTPVVPVTASAAS